jgi:hypothetical protein
MFYRALVIILLLAPLPLLHAAELVMDLVVPSSTERIAPQTYTTIRLLNTLPMYAYTVETKVQTHELPVLDIQAEVARTKAARLAAPPPPAPQPECAALKIAVDALVAATAENQVPPLAQSLRSALANSTNKNCVDENLATALLLRSERAFTTNLVLEKGKFVTVTASRIDPAGPKKIAEKVFDTGEIGSIRTHLLMGLHPNKDEQWFAKETGTDPAEYTITREVDRDSNDPFGAAFFTFLPDENTSGPWQAISFRKGGVSGSFGIGLGFDSEDPVYLAGYALNITESFGIALGVAGFNQARLKGIYKGDGTEKVTTNLQPDQLVEDTFGTGWFVGITVRR